MNWKNLKKLVTLIAVIYCFIPENLFSQDITAPGADYAVVTLYKEEQPLGSGNWVPMPPNEQDSVFVFCADNANAGTLVAPGSGCTYEWLIYDNINLQYVAYATTQTITGLASGGYKVVVTCGAAKSCYYAWVFVNQTNASLGNIAAGCSAFQLSGAFDKVSDFTVFSPPDDPFTIDANTEIEVCFTATHTYVSDLGFYLVAPGFGAGCSPNPAVPGQPGIVELLPAVSSWTDVTVIPSSVLSCDPSDIDFVCNGGNDLNNFCFTTAEPVGNPIYTACVCDLPVPLTGLYASAGPWSTINNQQVPALVGTAANCGWSVQIYDCEPIDDGYFTNATIKFTGSGICGPATHFYDSGTISSYIEDGSCDAVTASRYVIPPASPYQYTVANNISSAVLSCSGTWNPAWGTTDFLANSSPRNINPPPTVDTWFILTVTDNFGCVKIDSSLFVTNPVDATITAAGPFCENTGDQQLTAATTGGTWYGLAPNENCVSSSGLFHTNLGPGTYCVVYSIGGVCPAADTLCIIVKPELVVTNIFDTCIGGIVVSFDISGGNPSDFTVTGTTTGFIDGSGSFVSDAIIGQSDWTFVIDNPVVGCGSVTINGNKICDCETETGIMSTNLQVLCETESITSTIASGSFHQDSYNNDTLVYYLHMGPNNQIVDSVDANFTGTFSFNPQTMQYNTYYYISAVAANRVTVPSLWIDLADSCLDISQSTPVMWLQNPTASAGSDTSICGKTINLNATNPSSGNGHWAASSCVQFFSNTLITNPEVVAINYGDCTFEWIVENSYGTKVCSSNDFVTVHFLPSPTAYAGEDIPNVCGKTTDLTAVLSVSGLSTGQWSGGTFSSPTTENTSVTVISFGTYSFTWTETGNGGCTDDDIVSVTFVEEPEPVMPAYATICGLDDTIIVRNVKGNGYWTAIPGGITPFGDYLNDTTSIHVTTYGDINIVWSETLGGCSTSDTAIISFTEEPNASIKTGIGYTPTQTCGCSATLYADLGQSDFPGFWDTNIAGATFSDVDSSITEINFPCNSSIFGTESFIDVKVYWRQYNSNCTSTDIHSIRFLQSPQPFAGNDTISCSDTIKLRGRWSLGDGINDATGKWEKISGTGIVTYSPSDTVASPIITASPGIYSFKWTETNNLNSSCLSSDTVTIEFIFHPYFNAGSDTTICGTEIQLNALMANNPPSDAVTWIPISGMTFMNITDPHTIASYNTSGVDSVEFKWREIVYPKEPYLLSLGYACHFEDTVYVNFIEQPVAVLQLNDTAACGLNYVFKGDISNILGATYNLVDSFASTTITPQTSKPYYFNVEISDTTYGLHYFNFIVNNGVCRDTIDEPFVVNFYERPIPDAGPSDTACGTKFGLEATNIIPSATVQWSAIGSGLTFWSTGNTTGNTFIDTAIVAYVPQDRKIDLLVSVGPDNINCNGSASLNVKFRAIPNGDFTFTEPKCFGDTFSLAAVDNTQPLFTWTESFDILNYGSSPNLDWAWTNGDSIHNVTLVSTNIWECPSIPVTKQLNEPPIIKIDFVVDDTECNYNNGSLTANATGGLFKPNGYFTYEWGSPITTNINNQLQDSIYSGQYIVSVTDSWDCMVFDTVYVADFGEVTANFDTTSFETSYNAPATISFNNMSIDATTYKWYFNNTNTQGVYVDIKTIYTDSPWNPWFTFNPKIQFPGGAVIDSTNSNPSFTYEDGGDFWIFLIAISEYGCADTMYYEKIHVEYRPSIEAPNVFTPNGDGINDFFKIKVKSLESFQGVIFNRWGHKVYEFNDPEDAGWDGKVNGGSLASPGTYYYMIEGVGKDGTEFSPRTDNCETCKGFLQLIRD